MYWFVTFFAIHYDVLFDALTEQLEKEWLEMQAARLTDTRDSVHSISAATAEGAAPTKGSENGFTSSSSRSRIDVQSTLCLSDIQSGTIVDTASIQHTMSMQLPSLKIPRMLCEKENVAPVQDASVGQCRAIRNPGRLSLKGRKNMTVPSHDLVDFVSGNVCRPCVVSTTGNDILEAAVVESTCVISDHVVVLDNSRSDIRIEEVCDPVQCHLIEKLDALIVCRFSSTNELWTLGF